MPAYVELTAGGGGLAAKVGERRKSNSTGNFFPGGLGDRGGACTEGVWENLPDAYQAGLRFLPPRW